MPSELQQYYDHFCRAYWADPDPEKCGCRGTGWALSDVDTTHKCPIHYKGQPDPAFDDEIPVATCEHGVPWTEACHAGHCFRDAAPVDLSENVDSRGSISGGPDDYDPNEPETASLEDEVPF